METSQYDPNSKPEFELYTIPSHSSWFRWDNIHQTERIALKEFFNGSSISRTPKIYKEYRDFMIHKYREDPSRKMTFTQVRKSLVGDVSLLQKVFKFLDQWGLINFAATSADSNKDGLEDKKLKNRVRIKEGEPNGVRVVATPNSLRSISVPYGGPDGKGKVAAAAGFKLPPLASYLDVFGDLVKLKGFKCGGCGKQCDSVCYEYRTANFAICEKCFKNGNFGENKSKDDFKFNDRRQNSLTPGATWTEAETLRLLESVVKHGDNWELVAQNVPSKTKIDCISKLIELPFGEFMTGTAHEGNGSSCPTGSMNSEKQAPVTSSKNQEVIKMEDQIQEQTNEHNQNGDAASEEPPAKRKLLAPFSNDDGSLINQVALISTMVGPQVTAAAAAATAVTGLCDESSCLREIFDEEEDYLAKGLCSPTMLSGAESAHWGDASEKEENQSETQDGSQKNNDVPLALQIRAATATALGAAAANSKLLADQEDREIEHLVATILKTQLKKLYSKVTYFEDLELIMEKEYTEMLEVKECLLEERIDVLQRALGTGVSKWRDYTKSLFGSVL